MAHGWLGRQSGGGHADRTNRGINCGCLIFLIFVIVLGVVALFVIKTQMHTSP